MASKVYLSQLAPDILELLTGGPGGGAAKLEKEIISNAACGAANAGTKFPQGQSFTQFAETILLKDITPTISTSFSNSGVKEKGTQVSGSILTLNITNLGSVTVPINTINFYKDNVLIDTKPFVSGQATYNYNYSNLITQDTTFKAELVYNTDRNTFGTGTFTFVYASYYGVTALASISDADATGFASTFGKTIKTVKGFSWNNITLADQRFCYLYPVSMGLLSSIKDGNGFQQMDGYVRKAVNLVSPADGRTVPYYVYLLKDAATGVGFTQVYS